MHSSYGPTCTATRPSGRSMSSTRSRSVPMRYRRCSTPSRASTPLANARSRRNCSSSGHLTTPTGAPGTGAAAAPGVSSPSGQTRCALSPVPLSRLPRSDAMITDGLNPFALLGFLGAVLGGGALAVAYLVARVAGRAPFAKRVLLVGGIGAGAYLLLFAIADITSRDRVLAPGEEKHICEIDCHLAYSVAGAKTESNPAGGTRYTVTVKVRFDEETISPRRPKDAALSPNSRYVALLDSAGNSYPGSTEGLKRRLIPGESYATDITFDVPSGVAVLHLVLRNNDFETQFVIGHENSFGHGTTTFALAPR